MQEYDKYIKGIIIEKSGADPESVTEEAYFEDDLNIGEMERFEILNDVEETYKVDLSEERDKIETIGELIGLLHEKLE